MNAPSPTALLRVTLDSRWVSPRPGPELCVDARMPLPDGDEVTFHLRIDAVGFVARVREEEPRRIPSCAARHLFGDGTFCMGFGATGPPQVVDAPTAQRWWAFLRGYLELQVLAEATGEWDPRYERAHGNTAVVLEEILELITDAAVAAAIRNGELRTSDRPGRITRRRSQCPCGSGRQLRHCHESIVVLYLAHAALVRELETQAWTSTPGPCCGRMRRCPLNPKSEDP